MTRMRNSALVPGLRPRLRPRLLAAALGLLALGGCTYERAGPQPTALAEEAGATRLGPLEALARLAAAPDPLIVTQTRSNNGSELKQVSILPNRSVEAGQNRLEADLWLVRTDSLWSFADLPVNAPRDRFTQEKLRLLLAREFPGLEPQISAVPRRNAYGRYGFAVARRPLGVTCVLAWQRLQDEPDMLPRHIEGFDIIFRACDPVLGPEALLDGYDTLQIRPETGVVGYGYR
jgi:hypothetical protein